jgi:hypothetical protein
MYAYDLIKQSDMDFIAITRYGDRNGNNTTLNTLCQTSNFSERKLKDVQTKFPDPKLAYTSPYFCV